MGTLSHLNPVMPKMIEEEKARNATSNGQNAPVTTTETPVRAIRTADIPTSSDVAKEPKMVEEFIELPALAKLGVRQLQKNMDEAMTSFIEESAKMLGFKPDDQWQWTPQRGGFVRSRRAHDGE